MTEPNPTETTAPDESDGEAVSGREGSTGNSGGLFEDTSWQTVRRRLQLAAIFGLALLAAWASFRIYTSAGRAIAIWINPDFVPVFEAVFNAIVVVIAVAGILWLRRTLR